MRIYVLDMGYMSADKNLVIANAVTADCNHQVVESQWIKVPQIAFLIETVDGYVLYDCGPHHEAMKGRWNPQIQESWPLTQSEEQRFINQLRLCGVKPEDINTVIISHMHQDHFGNIELLTHADVYVPKADFMYAQTLVHLNSDRRTHEGYVKQDLETYVKEYHLVEEDFELLPGIEVINLPGHTPGLLGIVVHTDNNTYIMPQDACYCSELYGPPARLSGTFYDNIAFLKSIEKVRKLQKKYNANVIFSHDAEQFATLKKAPQYYN